MIPRLATSIWVAALLRRADAAGAYGAVIRKGDPEGGAVIVTQRKRDGRASAWARVAQHAGSIWGRVVEDSAEETNKVDEYLSRQVRYDPDLWIVELVAEEIQPLIAELSHMH